MKSEQQFPIGTRVKMTAHALRQHLDGRKRRSVGTVVGYSRKYPDLIRVLRDGSGYPDTYSPTFWEKI